MSRPTLVLAALVALAFAVACPHSGGGVGTDGGTDAGPKADAGPSPFLCDLAVQDCTTPGTICLDTQAGHASACVPGCDLVTQAGCDNDAGTQCGYFTGDGGVIARACGPLGTVHEGQPCDTNVNLCGPGLGCEGLPDGGGLCAHFCQSSDDCTSTEVCGEVFITFPGSDESPAICSTPVSCNLLKTTGCPTSESCYATQFGPQCYPTGAVTTGHACAEANDCVPGSTCVGAPGAYFCRTICAFPSGAPSCAGGEACSEDSALGQSGVGFCP